MKPPEEKEALRQHMREEGRRLTDAQTRELSLVIQQTLLSLPEFDEAASLGCYMAVPGEVHTDLVLASSWEKGRQVCVPAYDKEEQAFYWARLEKDTPLTTGPWHTHEPANAERVPTGSMKVIIVPGMAFDVAGGRLGHGGGYYDRLLAKEPGVKIALAFEHQVVRNVPVEKHDVRIDVIFTEKFVYRCGGKVS